MDVRIEMLEPVTVAYVRRQGPYMESAPEAWQALWQWAGRMGRTGDVRDCIGVGHDDPNVTPPEQCTYDACLALAGEVAPDDEVGVQTLPGGRYAILTLVGSYAQLPAAYDHLRAAHPEGMSDARPAFERYLSMPGDVPEAELRTEVCMPVPA